MLTNSADNHVSCLLCQHDTCSEAISERDIHSCMNSLGQRIAHYRKQKGLSQQALASACGEGWGQSRIGNYEKDARQPKLDELARIAGALGVTTAELLGEETPNTEAGPVVRGEVPVVSWVIAGAPREAVDNYAVGHGEDTVQVTVPVKRHTFALRVKGDSMTDPSGNGPSFPEGILIIVEPDLEARHKDFVVVKSDDETEASFKQLIIDGRDAYLKPLNPSYKTKPFPEDGRISGVVREAVWKLR